MDGNSPNERSEARNSYHHCGNCTLPRGARDADHAVVHHHHHHYHDHSRTQPQHLLRPQPPAPPLSSLSQQSAHALVTPPQGLPPSYEDVLQRDATTRSRRRDASPQRDRNDRRRRALFDNWEPVDELPSPQGIYANQHRNGGRLTPWEDIEVAPACTSRRGRSTTSSRRDQVRESNYGSQSQNINRSSNHHSFNYQSNHSSSTPISPIRFPIPSFHDNRSVTHANRDRSPALHSTARSSPSSAHSDNSLPPLYAPSSPANTSHTSDSNSDTTARSSDTHSIANDDDTTHSPAPVPVSPPQLRPSDHTPFSEDIRSGIRAAKKLVRTVFIEELLRIKQSEPFLEATAAWDRFVGRIVASGAIQSESEVRTSWHWAFEEPAIGHFRFIFLMDEDSIRSAYCEVV